MRIFVCLAGALICIINCSYGQVDTGATATNLFPRKYFAHVDSKTENLDKQLDKQTEKYLNKLTRKEAKLKKIFYKSDSAGASVLFANNPEQQYAIFLKKLTSDTAGVVHSMGPEYLPNVDSLQGTLSFLNKNPQLLNSSKVLPAQMQNSLAQLQQLQVKMQDADQIKQFMQQRRDLIMQYISKCTHLPPSVSNICSDYNKQIFYYQSEIRHYREVLNDPDQVEKTALMLLNKLPAFTDFMHKNSFLSAMFNMPSNYGTAEGLEGLQTRDQVMNMIQNQMGSGGTNASSAINNSIQTAKADIAKMQDKLNNLGGGSGDMDMPNFKPNEQKTKTLFSRLEYGVNLQTQHAQYYFPTTIDLGLSVGYKVSNKTTMGIGVSYKIGCGTDFSHIQITSQGAGLRSFIDVQAKKSFYLSGGYELNYQPVPDQVITQNNLNLSNWSKSGLIGISKIVGMTTKVFKKTKIQFFWDFLSYEQVPKTQPFKFRVGYTF